jgi:predicted XRE-type DNA-binding protein
LEEINEMIKSNLEHANDLEEQANSLRLQAKQLEGLKSFLEKQERKRRATEKSTEFKANYILQLKAEIEK